MCENIDRIDKSITDSKLKIINKDSELFLNKHKGLIDSLESEFRNRLDDDDNYSVPSRYKKYTYQLVREKRESYGRYIISDGCSKSTILDMEKLSKDNEYFSLNSFELSNDERKIVYSIDIKGDGICKIYIKDYFSDKLKMIDMDKKVGGTAGDGLPNRYKNAGEVLWSNDNKKLYYITIDDNSLRANMLWKYDIETEKHEKLYEEKDNTYILSLSKTDDNEKIILSSQSKTSIESSIVYEEGNNNIIKCVFKRKESLKVFLNHYNEIWYILLIKGDVSEILESNDLENFEVLVPYNKSKLIVEIYIKGGYGLIKQKSLNTGESGLTIIKLCDRSMYVLDFKNPRYTIDYPTISNLDVYNKKVIISYDTYLEPTKYIEYDLDNKSFKIVKKVKEKSYDSSNYVEKLLKVNDNGLRVTMLYKKGWKGEKTNCLLYGYGSYGIDEDPGFNRTIPSLLDRGFIYCYAHIRGGGYYGDKWYEDGKMLNKMNTFKDYIECGEYLIKRGYTSSDKLIGFGASAGGLLMGSVMNMKPKLFKLLIMGVPFLDVLTVMCDSNEPLTTEEYKEWGNPNIKKYYNYMLKYDPIRNIDLGKDYPNVYIYSNKNDSQVGAWIPYKYYNKLKDSKVYIKGDSKLMINIKSKYGHQGSSDRYEGMREKAELYAIILNSNLS